MKHLIKAVNLQNLLKVNEMVNLDKDVEIQIRDIFEKYQTKESKLLNYLIVDDEITFFLPLSDNSDISDEDIRKISEILNATYISMESVNQEYRFKFKLGE